MTAFDGHAITGETTVVGVIGWPVGHSLSPLMHNAAFRSLGMNWIYVPFAVPPEQVNAAFGGVRALGIRGVNITIPHKQAAVLAMDRLSPEAAALGSVNTVLREDSGALVGYSTDGAGFLRSLQESGCDPAGMRVAILGAGGAARAICGALASARATAVTVIARDPERVSWGSDGASPSRQLGSDGASPPRQIGSDGASPSLVPWSSLEAAVPSADLIINATPIGMAGHAEQGTPLPASLLHSSHWICDLVYTPRRTRLLQEAGARGCRTIEGSGMLLYQGAESFAIWTGVEAPIAVMREALFRVLGE